MYQQLPEQIQILKQHKSIYPSFSEQKPKKSIIKFPLLYILM